MKETHEYGERFFRPSCFSYLVFLSIAVKIFRLVEYSAKGKDGSTLTPVFSAPSQVIRFTKAV